MRSKATTQFKVRIGEVAWARFLARLSEVNRDVRARRVTSAARGHGPVTGYSHDKSYDWDRCCGNVCPLHVGIRALAQAELNVQFGQ